MKWLKRITDYYKDKCLAGKCGLDVRDICCHEYRKLIIFNTTLYKCQKCGDVTEVL